VLDIKLIREQPEFVRQRLASRGAGDEKLIDELLKLDEQRRKSLTEVEKLKSQRNRVSKEIGALMGQKKVAEAEARKQETRELGEGITALDKQAAGAEAARDGLLLRLPNLPHESVPAGTGAEGNQVVRVQGGKPEFAFKPKSHVELCESLKLVDFARAAKLSGSGFILYTGWGARLERALIQFMLDLHTGEHGYTEVSPPFVIKTQCMEGVGQYPKFKDQAYAVGEGSVVLGLRKQFNQIFKSNDELLKLLTASKGNVSDPATGESVKKISETLADAITVLGTHVSDSEIYALLPTAEAPVANIHREEVLKDSDLPIRYVAYSPCFRAEAGAAGVGTRGMIRVHQFDKVELIKIVKPESGYDELEAMVADAERVLQLLGLHYRVVLLCTGDMGFASAKTYDLEVWAAGQGSYLEVSSVSNCEDFQARRMSLRYKIATGENRFPHILNGSGTALARLFVALVERYQQADGSVVVPPALQPYLKADRITG
jgi:seryl-tRNA synthetase